MLEGWGNDAPRPITIHSDSGDCFLTQTGVGLSNKPSVAIVGRERKDVSSKVKSTNVETLCALANRVRFPV